MPRHYIYNVSYVRPPTGKKRHTFIRWTSKENRSRSRTAAQLGLVGNKAMMEDGERKFQMTGRPLSQQRCLKRGIVLKQDAGWSEHRSDLLFEGPLSSSGGSISGCSLHRLVGHDAGGKLLLGPLKAGARGAVQRMDLMRMWRLEQRSNGGTFPTPVVGPTFLNMIRDMVAREVKRTATMIMMMPTGGLLFRPVRAEIHPLRMRSGPLTLQTAKLPFQSDRNASPAGFTGDAPSHTCWPMLNLVLIQLLTWCPSSWCRYTGSRRYRTDRCTQRRTGRTGRSCRSCTQRRRRRRRRRINNREAGQLSQARPSRTWTPRKAACTSRRRNTAWRAGTRGWTDRSPRRGTRPQRTRPSSPPG